ncbi:MAG: GntR family transcriptional regulator [Tidjanibacter sp.]|nr:GntR family transcriptional regulator [Tidjanibacter sp.]MBQ1963896.1 GntR family transcriptional regulator [Tidjanibacter sp.]MBQ5807912.1 GntR family transcriptional regulator [Tidjanibacter sp.]
MEFNSNKPIWQHICNLVADRIILGLWREGDRIPSVRELAVESQVNPNTVMRAYDLLQRDGIIISQRGIGYFVAEGAAQKALDSSRREFLENQLPPIFERMEILGISAEDVAKLFEQYKQQNSAKR